MYWTALAILVCYQDNRLGQPATAYDIPLYDTVFYNMLAASAK